MRQPPSLLTTAQVATWLGISPRTVCLWAECSELPGIKVGRQWRFDREAIEQWLAAGKGRAEPLKKISVDAAIAAAAAYKLSNPPVKKEQE